MAAVKLQVIPLFFIQIIQKTAFLFLQTRMKCQFWVKNTALLATMLRCASCFLLNCIYHILLIGNIKTLLQKMDAFCFNYRQVGCLYTLLKFRFIGKTAVKSGQLFDKLQRAFRFNHQNRGMNRMHSIAKKRLLGKKYKKHLLSSLPKTKSTQTSGSVFEDRI